ncbi:hypothetical protein MMC28_002680 [Mycoblastus sanguinarius]|nr:hypothetical protein [Mycoblastus sanguinarius]
MGSILEGLNAAQHTAVTSPSNVLQVLAPPGSGKTKTLTSRVAFLLQYYHYKPWNVICLTFTIKSSREMKERIAKLLGNGIESRLILGTFHSVCRRYLVTYGHLIGLNQGFGIADSSDTIGIIKRIVKRLGLNIDPKKAQTRISSSKSKGITFAELAQEEIKKGNVEQQEFTIVFGSYEDQLARSNLLDYDDLLLRCADLLRQHPTCVSNVEAVLIDEFQDTNIVQFDLMRLFSAKHKRITTVGDPDQSIYGWRSAEIKNLKRMQKQYPDTLVIHLEDNYRSSAAILLAAREVIEQDESRPSKPLLPTHCPGTVPVLRRLPSAEIEASWIVSEILRVVGLTGHLLTYSDFAILLRSASLSRHVESTMGRAGIPYRMVGGQRFFDRIEIKILLDYLRVISQPHNNDALSRIINIPARGVGATTVKGLLDEAEAKKLTLWTLIRDGLRGHNCPATRISKAVEQGLGAFLNIILTSRNKILDANSPPEALLRHIIKKLDFKAYLQRNHVNDHEARWSNVEEIVAQASEYSTLDTVNGSTDDEDDVLPNIEGLEQQKGNVAEENLSNFLANVALATELQREDEGNKGDKPQSQVTISTIHAAKGLEWPVVFIPSAYEGCIPHSRAEDTDEERRLLYVAMTRAQALLYLSCPTKNSQREETTLSTFLSTKKVNHHLVNKAPTIDTDTVNDISQILRRDFPTEAQIADACEALQSRHDDLWPLDGEEDVKAIQARRSKWDDNGFNQHISKRRRIKESVSNTGQDHHLGTEPDVLSSIGHTTTMQSSSTFSCNGNSGFMTAAIQLQHDQDRGVIPRVISSRYESKATSYNHIEGPTMKNTVKARHRQEGQSDLLGLWGKQLKHDAEGQRSILPHLLDEEVGHSHLPHHKPATSSVGTTARVASESGPIALRKPLASIPVTLASHRLHPLTNTSRPDIETGENEPRKKQYVFLSSSPPPIEGLLEAAQARVECHHIEAVHGLQDSEGASRHSDVRPATTFHTTSVAQAQTASKGQKRTLGVRRSMIGWSSGSKQGFSVPKMAGGKL